MLRARHLVPLAVLLLSVLLLLDPIFLVGSLQPTDHAAFASPTNNIGIHIQPKERLLLNVVTGHDSQVQCAANLTRVADTHLPYATTHPPGRKIPKLIHETSKSRCLADVFRQATTKWRLDDHGYYFHDDDAVDRFLHQDWPEFPQLQMVLQCIQCPTIKADIWRYLILWEFGGIYSDIDTIPTNRFHGLMQDQDEAFFVIEHYNLLSQYFMAAAPRHPVMFYAVHISLNNVMHATLGTLDASAETGPSALHSAFQMFLQDVDQTIEKYKVTEGFYVGTRNSTIRAVGKKGRPDSIIERNSIQFELKLKGYEQMGMTYYQHRQKSAVNGKRNDGGVYNATCLSLLHWLGVPNKVK